MESNQSVLKGKLKLTAILRVETGMHGEEEFRLPMCRRSIHTRLQFAGSRTARIRDVHIVRPRPCRRINP